MAFETTKIAPKILWIIDIGTYKIRVGICKFHNCEMELLWYWEKRQNADDIVMHEFADLKNVCKNISLAIQKAEEDAGIQINDIVINIPFDEIFFQTSKINYIRENHEKNINKNELRKIIRETEDIALKKHYKNIAQNSGYKKKDIRLIIGWVPEIKADKKKVKKLLDTNPENINVSLLNIFIPENKYQIIQSMSRFLGKNIKKIIPSEFAVTNLFKKKQDVVIIDLWSTQTSIIVKKDNKILWVRKHAFGIDSLIKNIRKNYNRTKIEIIQTIDQDIYEPEKQEFLEIFENILVISLEEIVWTDICPNDFFMMWWGSNKFIRKYLEKQNLNQNNLKIAKEINFVSPKIEYFENIDSSKSNLNIYALMLGTLSFIKNENDPIEESLKSALLEISET